MFTSNNIAFMTSEHCSTAIADAVYRFEYIERLAPNSYRYKMTSLTIVLLI